MTNQIAEYAFRKEVEDVGFEIIKLDYFFNKKAYLDMTNSHIINFNIILFITEGKGKHCIDFKAYNYSKGSVLFVQTEQVHAWKQTDNINGFLILFTEKFLFNNQIKFQDISYTYPFNSSLYEPLINLDEQNYEPFYSLISYLFQEYYLQNTPVKQEILQNLLRTILLKIKSYPTKQHKDIDSDKKDLFIHFQKMLEEKITLSRNANDYCNFLNVSYRKLNLACKTLTNKTIKEFIDDFLILKAKRLLSDREINISQTAYKLGFDEVTNFTKFFKKHTNQTPKYFSESTKRPNF